MQCQCRWCRRGLRAHPTRVRAGVCGRDRDGRPSAVPLRLRRSGRLLPPRATLTCSPPAAALHGMAQIADIHDDVMYPHPQVFRQSRTCTWRLTQPGRRTAPRCLSASWPKPKPKPKPSRPPPPPPPAHPYSLRRREDGMICTARYWCRMRTSQPPQTRRPIATPMIFIE